MGEKQAFKLGPFVGGLNNVSQAGESKDNEVVELINFEVGLDTSLISRPPIEVVAGTSQASGTNQWDVLGIYRNTVSDWYLIVNKPKNATDYDVAAYPLGDFTASPTIITTTLGIANKFVQMAQYTNYAYFNVGPSSTSTGGRWTKGGSYAAISSMPKGNVLIPWRDRLWVANTGQATDGNRVWFSAVDATGPHPETWNTSTDFFDVGPGSGGLVTTLQPLQGYLEIFKEGATWRFSFRSSPKDGIQEQISPNVGAAGPTSVVGFENYCFVYSQGRVYKHINQIFDQININVKFNAASDAPDGTAPNVDLSLVNRRLLVRYQNSIYAYAIDSLTWSQWSCVGGTPGKFFELPVDPASATPSTYCAASRGTQQLVGLNKIVDPTFTNTSINNARQTNPNLTGTSSVSGGVFSITKNNTGFPELFLNKSGQSSEYDIPVASLQQFVFAATVSSTDSGTNKFIVNYNFLLRSGSTSTVSYTALLADIPNLSNTVTVPDTAILMNVSIKIAGTSPNPTTVTVQNPSVTRKAVASPTSIMRLTETQNQLYQNTTAIEYIRCYVKTKAYDYQANSTYKRLHTWGADVKTTRDIERWAIPLGKNFTLTWDQLEVYTWDQLEAGTWNNPLSWQNSSFTIDNILTAVGDISENGRFFTKAPNSLRFRQIQFALQLTTLGNSDTGPCKVFSLTTYTSSKEFVSQAAT